MSAQKWRGWAQEPGERRRLFVVALIVLSVIAVAAVVGTLRGDGLSDPSLWVGLALVPVLLALVRRSGLS